MLDSLYVRNFRCLKNFDVSKLGRVNLIVGKNNSGKSSVLEAIRLYCGNAQRPLLEEIAEAHDEKTRLRDSERDESGVSLPFEDYFYGRIFPEDDSDSIVIGDFSLPEAALKISHGFVLESEEIIKDDSGEISSRIRRRPITKDMISTVTDGTIRHALNITKGKKTSLILLDSSRFRAPSLEVQAITPCSIVPTQFISMNDLARDWDKILFSEHAEIVKQAMRYISPDFEDLAFVETGDIIIRGPFSRDREIRRAARVKMSGLPRSIPLNSLGDGMLRVFQIVLKIFPAKGGVLLIDEFENGLHFSIQEEIWSLIFDQASKLNIQVFATTHSWDCIESFSKVAKERRDGTAVLFRVGKSIRKSEKNRAISTIFEGEDLYNVTQAAVEVR